MVLILLGSTVCVHPHPHAQALETNSQNAPQAAPGQKTATPASAVAQGNPLAPPTRRDLHGRMTATPVSVVLQIKPFAPIKFVLLQQLVVLLLALPQGDSVPFLSATVERPIKAVLLGRMEA